MRHLRSAFSLVELSIVLAILGVVTAGGLSIGTTLVEQQANVASNANLDEINKAIQDYYKVNGFLPCPADRTVALGAAGLGTATNCGAAAPAGVIDTGSVRVGALPVRALGMRDRSIADEFGNRYIYAVTENHAIDKATFDNVANTGQITVQDGGGAAIASDVSYFVVSTGNDGKGARRFQTATLAVACGASTNLDVENCDDDATFRDTRFNNGSVAASFYDDFPRWLPKFRLTSLGSSGGSGSSLWTNTGDGIIYSVGTDTSSTNTNVGIGTTTPVNKLETSFDTASSLTLQYLARTPTNTVGNFAGIAFATGGTAALGNTNTLGGIYGSITQTSPLKSDIIIRANTGDNTNPVMIINSDGNAGIGTLTPDVRLDVEHTANLRSKLRVASTTSGGLYATSTNAGNGYISGGAEYDGTNWVARDTEATIFGGSANGEMVFFTNSGLTSGNTYTATERMRISNGGRVGINYNNPQTYLHVREDVSGNDAAPMILANFGAGAGTAVGLFLDPNGNHTVRAASVRSRQQSAGNFANLEFWVANGAAPANAMQISPNGNVGIGATSSDKLTVNGDVLASNYYISSDARLKHDIKPAFATAALEIIAGIKPVHFVWNKNDTNDIGVIAQDVEKVFPEAVSTDDKGFKRVAYDKLVLPVINAIKELHAMVKELFERTSKTEARVAALEKENAELKARIERLEKAVSKE